MSLSVLLRAQNFVFSISSRTTKFTVGLIGVLEIGHRLVFIIVKRFENWVCFSLQMVVIISRRMDSVQNTKPIAIYHHHVPLNLHQVSLEKTFTQVRGVCVLKVLMQKKVLDIHFKVFQERY
jgi:hypothetical protein